MSNNQNTVFKSYIRIIEQNISQNSIPQTGYLTPPQIAHAYNVPDSNGAGTKVGIISLGGGFLQSDLDKSFVDLISAGLIPSGTPAPIVQKVLVNGATGTFTGGGADYENALDIYCVATLVPAATIVVYCAPNSFNDFRDAIDRAVTDGCDFISISWGTTEDAGADMESAFQHAEQQKIPVFIASGDYGSSPLSPSYGYPESVQYPASSPLVTPIGGTHLVLDTNNNRSSEVVENQFVSPGYPNGWGGGGGVSDTYPVPIFQTGLTYKTYNTATQITSNPIPLSGRGVPDFSAAMNTYLLYFNGSVVGLGGTSAAAPTIAGIFARIKSLTGINFSSREYNNYFYENTGTFYDVTSGNNATYYNGYAATPGWDPVVGIGSPDIGALVNLFNFTVTTNLSNISLNVLEPIQTPLIPVTGSGGLGSITYSIAPSLPAGLSYTIDGSIVGTPTATSPTTTYTITVDNGIVSPKTVNFNLNVQLIPLSLQVNNPNVEVHPYTPINSFIPVSATGGSGTKIYSLTPNTLPGTLSFNSTNGQIRSGTVSTIFTTTYRVTVTDQFSQSTSGNFILRSTLVPLVRTNADNEIIKTFPYTTLSQQPLLINGGCGTISYSISPTTLPNGLNFNSSNGTISGTTELVSRAAHYSITAVDQANQTTSTNFILKVTSPLNVIDSEYQLILHDKIFGIMGTTSTGYGAELISGTVSPGDTVYADPWNLMIEDVERCLIHQTGTPNNDILRATTGTVVDFSTPARMYTALQFIEKNIGQVDPSQLETFTHNTRRITGTSWTSTNYSTTATMLAGTGYLTAVDWSWFYENQIRYFFNLGGKMQPEINIVGGRLIERSSWAPLINSANQVVFGRTEFLQAMANPEKKFTFIISGSGDWDPKKKLGRLGVPWVKHLKPIVNKQYKDTNNYAANALTVTFQLMKKDPSDTEYTKVVGSINFVAGLGFKKKGPKKKSGKKKYKVTKANKYNKKNVVVGVYVKDIFTQQIIGKYIAVKVQLETDFVTTYPNGSNGGIAAQLPQTQIVANSLSASPSPIPEFSLGIGHTSEPVTVTLRNNSTTTCTVSNIVLSGYTTGTVYPTALTIEPYRSANFDLSYTGVTAGRTRGYVSIVNNVNSLVLFTEVSVGSTDPAYVDVTTSTYDIISQDFIVNHAGGYFKNFTLNTSTSAGFSFVNLLPDTNDMFNITFNPKHLTNGIYSVTPTVVVAPLDSSQEPTTWEVPFTVRLNVTNRHIAEWMSCILGDNTRLGISYDVIDGRTYLTAGIGLGSPNLVELRSDESAFDSWAEVYRMPLENTTRKIYSKEYCVKSSPDFKYGDYFGVGDAEGSLLKLVYDGIGNLEVLMSTLYLVPSTNSIEALDMATAFRYYDSRRRNQLISAGSLVQGQQTYVFTGFDRDGETQLALVLPN